MKKIIGIIVASSVLLGAGTMYAKSDPAANLSNWYEHSFQNESDKLGAATGSGLWKTFSNVKIFVSEAKHTFDSSLTSFTTKRASEAISEIERYQIETENRLNQTVLEIKDGNLKVYAKKANTNEDIEEDVEQSVEEILEDVLNE
ncbi:hypothetical protein M9R32_08850 [Paenisporosarcina quisquiliarum]|uniref:Uncharacterized protein n=1 Tax=Paenisporosarcina quisquiliarum TaxID=365346 RepID=A0A9X3RD78_9BACL|nr:hypothetical protein [Paenisporosarcina quisquiliarum]MCZ8537286.1 hypothetical protein [Paenisporosarcina quisquiliarum]